MLAKDTGILEISKYFKYQNYFELPFQIYHLLNYLLQIRYLKENIPSKYLPKEDWQWFFSDEIEKCIENWRNSLKFDDSPKGDKNSITNEYAKNLRKIIEVN